MILLSFVAAFALTLLPLPQWAQALRPEWVALVLIYWCTTAPQRVGVGVGWSAGLLLDVTRDALLGQYALSFAVVAYLAVKLHQHMRALPLAQQAPLVLALIVAAQALVLLIKGVTGQPVWGIGYWLPTLSSALLWPAVVVALRGMHQRYAALK